MPKSNSESAPSFTPPMINGVTASKVFLPNLQISPITIYDFLIQAFSHIDALEWQQRFQDGLIYNADGNKLSINSAYQPNSHIFYYRFLANEIHVPFKEKILYENDDLLVVDKPHFLTMSPTGQYVQETLLVRLKQFTDNPHLTPIHRLDRETAGVVLFSKKVESRGVYQQLFADRKVSKTYQAIAPYSKELVFPRTVELRMEKGNPFYVMKVCEGVTNSVTEIDLIEHNSQWGRYILKPLTGKQHQLRVHLNALNIPIKNDPFYPVIAHKAEDDFSAPLQLLADELQFIDPRLNIEMHFKSTQKLTL